MSGCWWWWGLHGSWGTGKFGENTSRGKPAPRLEIRTEPSHVQDGREVSSSSHYGGESGRRARPLHRCSSNQETPAAGTLFLFSLHKTLSSFPIIDFRRSLKKSLL